MKRKRNKISKDCLCLLIYFLIWLSNDVESTSIRGSKGLNRYLLPTSIINDPYHTLQRQGFHDTIQDLHYSPSLSSRGVKVNPNVVNDDEVTFNYGNRFSTLDKWKKSSYKSNIRSNPIEKESQIAEIFIGVAYGTSSPESLTTSEEIITASSEAQKVRSAKKYFSLIKPTTSHYQYSFYDDMFNSKSRNSFLVQESKSVKKSPNIFKEKSQNLMRENPSIKFNFSLPQLFISTEEMNSNEHNTFSISTKSSILNNNNINKIYERPEEYSATKEARTETLTNETQSTVNETKYANLSNLMTNESSWIFTRYYYSYAWMYHDHIVLILFSLLSLFPIIILVRLHFIKRDHITPRYCSLLTVHLLIVCISRIALYSIDPFAVEGRISSMMVSFLNFKVQSLLICSAGIFLVILIFPIYRPKSQILPRILTSFLVILMILNLSLYFACIFHGDQGLYVNVKIFVNAINFAEIGTLSIGYTFLNLCTRQKHKIWWIRVYKKTLTTSTNYSFSVLYSKLRKSIRLGSFAVFIQLINTILTVTIDFDFRDAYYSYPSDAWVMWVEESVKRIAECSVCIALILGVNLLFVPKMRTVIKKRGSFKTFTDIIKGRRRKQSKDLDGSIKQSSSIFTLNRQNKSSDYVATDFQLVWNQNRNIPLSSTVGSDIQKSTKSLDFAESSLTTYNKKQGTKLSRSVDILNSINEPKTHSNSGLYDNLKNQTNRTPIYQNQYIHYDYAPKIYEPNIFVYHNGKSIPNGNENKKRSKKNPRPKSYAAEEKPQRNENYLTSYFSVLSMDRFADGNLKECATQPESKTAIRNLPPPSSVDEINSPMISTEKWKDIKITQKFCTIKINPKNSRKKISTSKSVDLF